MAVRRITGDSGNIEDLRKLLNGRAVKLSEIIKKLESLSDSRAVEGMSRFGITPEHTYGVSIANLRKIAGKIKVNHELALELWKIDTRETRILASMTADPTRVSDELIENWTDTFTYWEICDQCCMNLFAKTALAYEKAGEYAIREEEFFKRTGFVIMARLTVSDKKAKNARFESFLTLIIQAASDDRNMVKKAVNWALRQIGKRNLVLNRKAMQTARKIQKIDSRTARWIASDALRELESQAVQQRLKKKADCGKV